MNTQSQTLFNQVSKTTKQEQETPSKESVNNQSKTFSTVDMWNIQRQRKTIVIR